MKNKLIVSIEKTERTFFCIETDKTNVLDIKKEAFELMSKTGADSNNKLPNWKIQPEIKIDLVCNESELINNPDDYTNIINKITEITNDKPNLEKLEQLYKYTKILEVFQNTLPENQQVEFEII